MKIELLACLALALFLSNVVAAQVASTNDPEVTAKVLAFEQAESEFKEIRKELKQMEKERLDLLEKMQELDSRQMNLIQSLEKVESIYDGVNSALTPTSSKKGKSLSPAGFAAKQLQETQISFNLQYLQLQQQMQSENRSYEAISDIMKTKHDTAKNSISNIR
ncbi:hypothetical protein GCM10009119_18220 [Algoriphagus jejuensis]|uniref:Outer membrane protein n=1 Tax=Algoriphagus jejuensis TaxID=419934 RepID=A0ABN1MZJ8_9BACT